MVAYSTPMTPAPMTVRLRGRRGMSTISSLSNTVVPLKGTLAGRYGRVPTAIRMRSAWKTRISPSAEVTSMRCGSRKRAVPLNGLDTVAGELVLEHIDLVVEGHVQAHHQVVGGDVLLHAVGAAVEAALAPAGQVEHGLAEGLRGDGAGVDRDATDAAALLDHEDGAAELCRLDGGAAAGGAAADDDEVVGAHGWESEGGRGRVSIANCAMQRGWGGSSHECLIALWVGFGGLGLNGRPTVHAVVVSGHWFGARRGKVGF